MTRSDDGQRNDGIERLDPLRPRELTHDRALQAFFDAALDAMLIADDMGRYIDANSAACTLFGLSKDQLLGKQIRDFASVEYDFEQAWQYFLNQGYLRGEFELRRADGGLRTVEYAATANFLPHCHLSILRDMSDRKQTELDIHRLNQELEQRVQERTQELEQINQKLQQEIVKNRQTEQDLHRSKEQLQDILTELDDIVWSSAIDGSSTYFVNSAVERIYGYPIATFLNNPQFWLDLVHPDDRHLVAAGTQQLYQNGRHEFIYRIQRADGQIRWLRDRARIIRDEAGQAIRVDGIATDITDRYVADVTLTRRNAELQALHRISDIVLNESSLDHAFVAIIEEISTVAQFPMVAIERYDADRQMMVLAASHGMVLPKDATKLEVPAQQTLSGHVATTAQLSVQHYAPNETKSIDWHDIRSQLALQTFVCIPLLANAQSQSATLGTLSLAHSEHVAVDQHFLDWGTSVANSIAALMQRKQVEADRRNRDEMLQKLSTQIPGMIYQFRYYPDGRSCFPYASESIRRIYEVTPEQVKDTADPALAVLHPDDYDAVVASILHSFETLEFWSAEYRVILPERGLRWLEGHSRPERLADGSVLWHGYIWDITERKQIEQEIWQQAERERLLITITQHIRQSLDLYTILSTTVREVLNVLQCDRVFFYRLYPNGAGIVEKEALAPGQVSLASEKYQTNCYPACYPDRCNQAAHYCTEDTAQIQPEDCALSYMLGQNAKAQLIVPILHQHALWGLLVAHQCDRPRQWQPWEAELLSAIANQVSIAIHQAHLYRQVQQFNVRLERQVQERTETLRQSLLFESLLKRITDRVRDSLDKDQILQAAVQELASGLGVICCDAGFYSDDYTTCTITHERTQLATSAKNFTLNVVDNLDVHRQLLQGETVYICLLEPHPIRANATYYTVFACPLADDQRVLGNLWLFKSKGDVFNDLEMRLAQQVANQCAIALRQSRLYRVHLTSL